MAKLKNYTTSQSVDQIVAKIQATLGAHGAKRISFDYDDAGQLSGIYFSIEVKGNMVDIKLPTKVDKVKEFLKRAWESGEISHKRGHEKTYGDDQVKKVAWANILDWIEAQMTFIDIEQVKLEQVFLPYVVNKQGQTLFEVFEKTEFKHLPMLPGPADAVEGEVIIDNT